MKVGLLTVPAGVYSRSPVPLLVTILNATEPAGVPETETDLLLPAKLTVVLSVFAPLNELETEPVG